MKTNISVKNCRFLLSRSNKTALILLSILIAVTMLLCACGESEPPAVWDPVFIDSLNLTKDTMHALNDSVQTINQTSLQDYSTVHIKQTVGDAMTIHIVLDITFNPNIDIASLSFAYDLRAGEVPRPTPENGLQGSEVYQKARDYSLDAMSTSGGSNLQTINVDPETNTITYLISFHSNTQSFDEEELSLLIGDFTKDNNTGENVSACPDLHIISWSPQNKAPVLELKILADDGKQHGYILLSTFSFVVNVYSDKYTSAEQIHKPIDFLMRDGTVESISNYASGSGGSNSRRSFLFSKPLDVANVKAVQIGNMLLEAGED